MNGRGTDSSRGFRYWIAAAPPTAEASEPTTVTPIWTVARKRWGSFWIASTSLALAGGNNCQFRAREKSVDQNQKQNDDKFIEEHFHGYLPP
jgi:hypothetical protein